MRPFIIITILFISIVMPGRVAKAQGQTGELQQHYMEAMAAYKKGDYTTFYNQIKKALELHPYHQGILYQAGIASALNNKIPEAVGYLKKAVLIQADFNLMIPDLSSLKGNKEFEKLKEAQREAARPIITSDTAVVINDRSLHVEGIVIHENMFYLGSIRHKKIVTVNEQGVVKDFTHEGSEGLTSVFALKVNAQSDILWACSSPMPEMKDYSALTSSAVFKYDLKTGRLVRKFLPENRTLELILGDLTLNKKGEAFVADSKGNLIFKANEGTGKLEQFFSSDDFWNIQGITFSDDDKYLFIADYIKGIFRLDMKTMRLTQLSTAFDASVKSVDGLLFYGNTLIATQNSIVPARVTQYQLNNSMDGLVSYSVIDRAHPAFNEPTQACLYDNSLYYVANSQWSGYDDNHHPKPEEQLQDIVILKSPLK